MAPEYLLKMRNQLPPGTVIDLRLADVYSLGAVTYRMWTGRYPYLLSNGDSLAEKILSQSFPAPRSINPRLPASCDHLMKKWLNRDPGQRPSIEELHCELDRYAGGMTRFPANFTYVQPRHSLIDRLMGK
jgi:serine/threonine protein kinase